MAVDLTVCSSMSSYTAHQATAQCIVIGPVYLFPTGGRGLWVGVFVGLLPR